IIDGHIGVPHAPIRTPASGITRQLLAGAIIALLLTLVFWFQQTLTVALDPALADLPVSAEVAAANGTSEATDNVDASTAQDELDYRRFANTLPLFALGLLL